MNDSNESIHNNDDSVISQVLYFDRLELSVNNVVNDDDDDIPGFLVYQAF